MLNKSLLIAFLMTFSFSLFAGAREDLLAKAQSMTNDEVWNALTTMDANGNSGFGKCRVANGYPACASCACPYYFKGWSVAQPGILDAANANGWPKNSGYPNGASTGCIMSNGQPMGDGAEPQMLTADIKANVKAILLNALDNSKHKYPGYSDVCGTSQIPASQKASLSIMDSSKLFFVRPTESCAAGKVLCGTTSIGQKSGSLEAFNPLPSQFCAAAYGVIKSSMASYKQQGKSSDKDSRFISCAQYSQRQLDSQTLSQAGSVLASMNTKFSGCDLIPYCDYGPSKIETMVSSEIALFYVATGEKTDSLPAVLRPKVATLTPVELETARTAYKALQDKVPNASGQTYTLADAVNAILGKK